LVHQVLTVRLHDSNAIDAPEGWAEFAAKERLASLWSWPLVRAAAAGSRAAVLAATLHDGPAVVGLATARFGGLRVRRGRAPLAGVVDVESLTTSSLPGIALACDADADAFGDAAEALQDAFAERYGGRVRAVMLRQVSAGNLPAVLRRPAIVREGGPISLFANRFDSFDAYARSLGKRRWELRRVYRIESDPDLAIESTLDGPVTPITAAELCRLVASVVDRHHRKWWLRKRYLSEAMAAAQLAAPGIQLRTYRDQGRLVAAHLCFDHPDLPLSGAWGAYSVAEGGRRDLWYHSNAEVARWCIETGRRGYLGGQGSLVEKKRLGHEMLRQWAVLIPRLPGRRAAG
jgi:hypothetical protein